MKYNIFDLFFFTLSIYEIDIDVRVTQNTFYRRVIYTLNYLTCRKHSKNKNYALFVWCDIN